MATEQFRKKFMPVYREERSPDMYLSSLFPVSMISDTEIVALDIERENEEIAPVVTSREGPTFNTVNQFTTKEWTPPTINPAAPFDVKQLMKRFPGMDEYQAADTGFVTALILLIARSAAKLEKTIARNREWQASQILQDGRVQLTDENGNLQYEVDYLPKGSHMVQTGATWGGGSDAPLDDIDQVAEVIRDDSLKTPDTLLMGKSAFAGFIKNQTVLDQLDNRRLHMGEIRPMLRNRGEKYQGTIHISNYEYDIITYGGRGIVPGGSTNTMFLDPDNCIVMASEGRLDTVFAGVPQPVNIDPRFADFLPSRIAVPGAVDVSPNIYGSPNGKQIYLELESRPLLIPTAIDSFARINTVQP